MSRQVIAIGDTGAELVTDLNANFTELYLRASTNAINVKDYGALGDGITDDTVAIQSAINAVPVGGRLYFPLGTYMVQATGTDVLGTNGGLVINQSMSIMCDRNAELKAIQGWKSTSKILFIENASYVDVGGLKFTGDYDARIGVDVHEGNHCLQIVDSSNIYIHDCYFSKAAGDCIACYRSTGNSKNIIVERCEFTDYRRWGIFVDVDSNFIASNCYFHDVLGDLIYGGGLDVEYHGVLVGVVVMTNIIVKDSTFENIGDGTHSANGAISANAIYAIIDGIKFLNNFVTNCERGMIANGIKNMQFINNTLTNNTYAINVRGNGVQAGEGIISNNTLTTKGIILLSFGSITLYDVEKVVGLIISNNIFTDYAANPCITGTSCRSSQLSIINNIFNNCTNPYYNLTPSFFYQLYVNGNVSIGSDGLVINDSNVNFSKATTYTQSRGLTTGEPTMGTYEVGEYLNDTGFIALGYMGHVCITAGTMDVVNTVCTAVGTDTVEIVDVYGDNIFIGQYISINGGAALKIIGITGTNVDPTSHVQMSGIVPAGVGVSFVNVPATFKMWGALEP